jgi:biopolymer transport protein ExbB
MFKFFLQNPINDSIDKVVDNLSQASNGISAPVSNEPTEFTFSVFSMIQKGGPMMIPIGFLFVLALFVLIERLIVISKASKKNEKLLATVEKFVSSGDIDSARAICNTVATPENVMIEKGLARIGNPAPEIQSAMNDIGKVELGKLERHLGILNIIGRIAPMFGFIGTIIGVIKIFFDISKAKTVDIETISTGLYEKMVCSASGLVIGVLAFVAYHWLTAIIDKIALRLEESQIKFMDILQKPSK